MLGAMPSAPPALRTLRLQPGSPRERGRAHGEHFRSEIAAIAAIRSELCQTQGMFRTDEELVAVAQLHLPVLARWDAALFEELCGIAEGAGLSAERIVVLNHYTDLKDLDPRVVLAGAGGADAESAAGLRAQDEDCSAIVAGTATGAVLGQTWDMHGSAAPFVVALHVPAQEGVPEAWVLSITGCLGMAGMNRGGLGVAINNLRSGDAHVGLVWPALVRRALRETTAALARDVVTGAPLGSGHHYLVADPTRAFGIETSGRLVDVWAEADVSRAGTGFHHENHCLGVVVDKVSSISAVSTTMERFAFLEASLRARPIQSAADLWSRLGSHDGHPRSVCTHLSGPDAPHATETCGGVLLELGAGRVGAIAGCLHERAPVALAWDA